MRGCASSNPAAGVLSMTPASCVRVRCHVSGIGRRWTVEEAPIYEGPVTRLDVMLYRAVLVQIM